MIKSKKGSIIYISSTSGIDSDEGRGAYSDTKAAIISKSKTLSKELGRYNIRVNCIAPGLTNTRMMTENTSEDNIKKVIENLSLKRFAETNEIANVALFLSSDLATYLTGQTIRVDGGMKLLNENEDFEKIKKFSDNLRKNILKMAYEAGSSSSHLGGALSIVEIMSVLFCLQMKLDFKIQLGKKETDLF